MKFKEWSPEFEIGIGAIDQDHQTLFNSIRQLGEHIHQDRGEGRIKATINALLLYVDEHFEREERFMIRAGYPDFEVHKQEHDAFRDSIMSLRDFHETCPGDIDAQKIVTFLENWLLNHILKIDVQYQPYLNGEKQGDPSITNRFQANTSSQMVQIACPIDKEDHVRHFIKLITESSEEGALVDQAVEKITRIQTARREKKAKELFGK
ncbi:bacteriohemerythrin [Terasakiella sp. A23]|uniref:bacteriohemerythrin n=1 Tax=Terasakiella sp. FCG-A23 TaxID=3080561 RepID=UPI002954CC57|nr:bacteriohemerythrin [Terasakiella sp. A23]MDV7339823.1 bacteriohemerythrin [Terasakiella sp. A23]